MKKIVFMGDSITAGFKRLSEFENIINMGVGGYKTTELIPMVKELRLHQPDVVFLMIGINDFLCNLRYFPHGYTIPFHKTYDALVEMITVNLPRTQVYLISMLPMTGRPEGMLVKENVRVFNKEIEIINRFIKEKSKAYKAIYLDLYSEFVVDGLLNDKYSLDGIHLSEAGYDAYLNFLKEKTNGLFI